MSFGFIVLRHVNNKESSKYWKICYGRIRKYYPEVQIILIDDNSNYDFIKKEEEEKLYKTNKYPHKRIWQVGMIMYVRLKVLKDKKPNEFKLSQKYFRFLGKRTKIKDDTKRKKFTFKF